MRWTPRPVVAAAGLLALYITVPVAFGENDNDKTESPAASTTLPAIPGATIHNKHEVGGVLGREVRSAADEDMGRIADVLVDRAGRVCAAIIDFGGIPRRRQPQDRGELERTAFSSTGQVGRTNRT